MRGGTALGVDQAYMHRRIMVEAVENWKKMDSTPEVKKSAAQDLITIRSMVDYNSPSTQRACFSRPWILFSLTYIYLSHLISR